jgi:GNAT superfamily N-acetyltransferase
MDLHDGGRDIRALIDPNVKELVSFLEKVATSGIKVFTRWDEIQENLKKVLKQRVFLRNGQAADSFRAFLGYTKEDLEAIKKNSYDYFLIEALALIEERDEIVGWAVRWSMGEKRKGVWVFVRPSYRRRGFGSRLVDSVGRIRETEVVNHDEGSSKFWEAQGKMKSSRQQTIGNNP